MMRKGVLLTASLLLGASAQAQAATPGMGQLLSHPDQSRATNACAPGESWRFDDAIPAEARAEFGRFLAGKLTPARSFSQALSFRRVATSLEARSFAEYWVSRTLLSARMDHAAFNGFGYVAGDERGTARSTGVQLAALQCLSRLNDRYPSFELPVAAMARSAGLPRGPVTWDFAARALRQQLNQDRPAAEVTRTLAILQGSGLEESFAQGLWAEKLGNHKAAIPALGQVVSALKARRPEAAPMRRYEDQARLLLARAYYGNQQFDRALRELDGIRKQSNELSEALSELAWAALMQRHYSEAIGAAINLQAGGLRRTFAPEGPMVTAMALNELCQYPMALKATHGYIGAYEKSYRWLQSWNDGTHGSGPMYAAAVQFLREKKSRVPDRVGSEWLRSPVFVASQEELNLLLDEQAASTRMSRQGSREEKALARSILARARELKSRMAAEARAERSRQKTYVAGAQWMSAGTKARLAELRGEIAEYRRYRRAGLAWRGVLASQQRLAAARHDFLVARVDQDLSARNRRMYAELQEIAENNQLIEVEIYEGASQDMIWQNAHRDFQGMARGLASEDREAAPAPGKTWDWGHRPASSDAWSEVWEDELGSFKASVADNCRSKGRYLEVKKQRLAGR